MSTTIEWASADQGVTLLVGNDEAGDGNTPNGEARDGADLMALTVEGCAIYGTPGQLLELLSDAVSMISAELAGQ